MLSMFSNFVRCAFLAYLLSPSCLPQVIDGILVWSGLVNARPSKKAMLVVVAGLLLFFSWLMKRSLSFELVYD